MDRDKAIDALLKKVDRLEAEVMSMTDALTEADKRQQLVVVEARNQALEDAAKCCNELAEGWWEDGFKPESMASNNCADHIRALKGN